MPSADTKQYSNRFSPLAATEVPPRFLPNLLRRRIILACGLAACAAAAWAGYWRLKARAADRTAVAALTSLERGVDVPYLQAAIEKIDGYDDLQPELRLFRGACLLREGDQPQALKLLGSVRPEGRMRIARLILSGEVLYRQGRLSEAEETFRVAASERPEAVGPHRWLVTILHDLGAMHAALKELEQVARLEPDDYFAYRLMGLAYNEDFGRYKEAVENYQKALERNPPRDQTQQIRRELAQCLIHLNDYAGALEVLKNAADDAGVLALRAECRWSLTDLDAARKLLDQAIKLDPRERAALLLTARIALDDGEPRHAVPPLQNLIDSDPHDYDARYQLSRAYQRLGEKEAAAAELEKMNESKALREKLGHLYDQAMSRAHDPEIRDEIADLCDALGKHDLARNWRRAAEQCRQRIGKSPPSP